MENYDVIKLVGEGSFARVYKARHTPTESVVALKVIGKHGRSMEEITCLRQEFEIQRRLNHPNIIRMLDSFETNLQIVAVTEYAPEALYTKLGIDGYLSEDQACRIVCDLVSALYYLHSNRVLHRDLKPQNILLEKDGTAKLCDFGFARSMTTGTHVLTSIKGTPLYMAPELIEESPYDHNADLWSLGCIAYELLVGCPPFQTTSIVRLVRLIQNEPVVCPDFLSKNSRSFLEGLLEKNPTNRLTWPHLLFHPFVDGRVYIDPEMSSAGSVNVVSPLTCPLTVSQTFAKERQIKHLTNRSQKLLSYATRQREDLMRRIPVLDNVLPAIKSTLPNHSDLLIQGTSPDCDALVRTNSNAVERGGAIYDSLGDSSVSAIVGSSATSTNRHLEISPSPGFSTNASSQTDPSELASNKFGKLSLNSVPLTNHSADSKELVDVVTHGKSSGFSGVTKKSVEEAASNSVAVSRNSQKLEKLEPIQSDEWIVFLKQTIEEVMDGQIEELMQENFVGMLVAPLRNPSASAQVVDFIACLLSLPFIVKSVTEEQLVEIKEVYLEVKVVPNLVYASSLLAREKLTPDVNKSITSNLVMQPLRPVSSFSTLELQALNHIYLVLCKIMYECGEFLAQFCDATAMLNSVEVLRHLLLLGSREVCIVTDLLAILSHVMRNLPENANLVEKIVLVPAQGDKIELIRLMNHQNPLVRSRACLLLSLLGRFSCRALQAAWDSALKTDLMKMHSDKANIVRAASREAVRVLSTLPFYNDSSNG